jgi:hypothetical protein
MLALLAVAFAAAMAYVWACLELVPQSSPERDNTP